MFIIKRKQSRAVCPVNNKIHSDTSLFFLHGFLVLDFLRLTLVPVIAFRLSFCIQLPIQPLLLLDRLLCTLRRGHGTRVPSQGSKAVKGM